MANRIENSNGDYMTIAEVAERFCISADTLRYYEKTGLVPPVHRNKSGLRDYTENDCNWVRFVICMRRAGIPIKALAEYILLFQQGEKTHSARKMLLQKQLADLELRLADMEECRSRLQWKIEHYDDQLIEIQKKLE
ncbi:MAG: MerR family transcriptional regulator [Bacteroides sp.]|nr:MerR family transcriptional regulator [Prevotella sp.]MCM1407176.1 MerR family transcriptional regulator [Treponema brennaborense]MCM1470328.1 MerR family transcriptional regulator [Bacteroides sp.]